MEHESWDSDSNNLSYATPSVVLISLEIEGRQADHRFETMINIPVFREKAADAL